MFRFVVLAALCLAAFAAPNWEQEIAELRSSNIAMEKRMLVLEEKVLNSTSHKLPFFRSMKLPFISFYEVV